MKPRQETEKQAAELFEAALDQPANQRQQFVRDQCSTKPALAEAVGELLKFHEQGDGDEFLLDQPLSGPRNDETNTYFAEFSEREGDIIGRYKLLERIGEGGMGVVYMAQQTTDVQRRVALKIIKLGMDTRQVVARFETERQAMALFDHSGITRLLDAGATESGRPYYVMELVKGCDVVEFAEQHELSIEQRLTLIIDICYAFQHAHQKGIIHRDIKPSNILVGMVDGKPTPKVIDFGIAKALHHRLADNTVVTRHSAFIGTPQYMSPEQAQSSGVDVDTRSDIYGLGVLLYELLTGTTPLCKKELSEMNPLALIETVRNQDVETPSTRISKLNTSTKATHNNPPKHRERFEGVLPSELDWIVMKALAKERGNRYQSANELADDIKRFLNGDAIEAAPPSRGYRIRTHVRKHFKAYAVGAFCCGLVLLSAVSSLIFGMNAQKARTQQMAAMEEVRSKNEELESKTAELLMANQLIEKQNLETRYRKILDITSTKSQHQQITEMFEPMVAFAITKSFGESDLDDPGDDFGELIDSEFGNQFSEGDMNWGGTFHFHEMVESLPLKDVLAPSAMSLSKISEDSLRIQQQAIIAGVESPENSAISEQMQKVLKQFAVEASGVDESEFESPGIVSEMIVRGPGGTKIHFSRNEEPTVALDEKEKQPIKAEAATRYFRILDKEFRAEFGDVDPRVALASNLLAASLIQEEKFDEAQATLRMAISITNDEQSKTVSRRLLAECR